MQSKNLIQCALSLGHQNSVMGRAERLWFSVLNALYIVMFVISRILLHEIWMAQRNTTYSLTRPDWMLIAVCWMPSALCYICCAIALSLIIIHIPSREYHTIHCGVILYLAIDTLTLGRFDLDFINGFIEWYNEVSLRRGWLITVNIILFFFLMAIPIAFIPVSIIFLMFHREETPRRIGLVIQSLTVIINVMVHQFLLHHFGSYSLSIILCGMLYFILGVATLDSLGIMKTLQISWKCFLWIILEILLLFTMITITFVVEYKDSVYHAVAVILFAVYLFVDFPFTKWLLFLYLEHVMSSNECYQYLVVAKNKEFDDILNRRYCLLHSTLHSKNNKIHGINERHSLMKKGRHLRHKGNTAVCFKMLWNFYRSDRRMKRKMINQLHMGRNREIAAWIGILIYVALSMVSILYPVVWSFYVWIHVHLVDKENIINDAAGISSKSVWCRIIAASFAFVFCVWTMMCIVDFFGNCGAGAERVKARLFVWSTSKQLRSVTLLNASRLGGVLLTVGAVLESECLPMNMALIILDYLYYK